MTAKASKIDRGALVTTMLAGGLTAPFIVGPTGTNASAVGSTETNVSDDSQKSHLLRNPLMWAVARSSTAAEFGALCHQAFNFARLRVD